MTDRASCTTSVLVAGATGMLGGKIAAELLSLPGVDLRLLATPDSRQDPRKKAALVARSATIVDGNLTEPVSLDAATAGVDVVISAVQGGRDVIVEGQVALAKAAARNGARRILPSDFALDIFKAPPASTPPSICGGTPTRSSLTAGSKPSTCSTRRSWTGS